MKYIALSLLLVCLQACTTTQVPVEEKEEEKPDGVTELIFPLSNKPKNGRILDVKKGDEYVKELKTPVAKDNKEAEKQQLRKMIMARSVLAKDFDEILRLSNRLSLLELREGVGRKLDDKIKFAMSFAAFKSGKYGFFYLWTDEILASKDNKAKALVLNLRALMAYKFERIAEAMDLWKKALAMDPACKACSLNVSLVYLKSGLFQEANQWLNKSVDWVWSYAMISMNKGLGKDSAITQLCEQVLMENPDHAPTLYNCGVYLHDSLGDRQMMKSYLDGALKAPVEEGDDVWRADARRMLESLKMTKPEPKTVAK